MPPALRYSLFPIAPIALLICLGGCASLLTQGAGAGAGVGAAAISNAFTKNGAVTAGIGLGAQAAATAGVQYLEKRVHDREQNAIAAAAGGVSVGGAGAWSVVHEIPIEDNEHGEVTVTRQILPVLPSGAAPAFDCKEIVFSVDTVEAHVSRQDFYTATVCRDGALWRWATAEPATERWGSLQ